MPDRIIIRGCGLSFLAALTFCSLSTQQLPAQIGTFYLRINPINGPHRLSEGWIDTSPQSCADNCLKSFADCNSFMYNAGTGLCTPGSLNNKKNASPSQTEGSLYGTIKCDSSLGFTVHTYGYTVACVGVFEPALNYSNADASCKSKGGFLMSVKSKEKLAILIQIWNSRNTWIGCDDLQEPGVYRWKEDNSQLTNDTISDVFVAGELKNRRIRQPCGNIAAKAGRLAVFYCPIAFQYACEVNIP